MPLSTRLGRVVCTQDFLSVARESQGVRIRDTYMLEDPTVTGSSLNQTVATLVLRVDGARNPCSRSSSRNPYFRL